MLPAKSSFRRRIQFSGRWRWLGKLVYALKAIWRRVRISRRVTYLFGPQYSPSRQLIEIDITYACNLHCLNCNRSVTQAPDHLHMPVSMISAFVQDSIVRGIRWQRIRVLGGEPTLHPEFSAIMAGLLGYRQWCPSCRIEVVSNGYGDAVKQKLDALPNDIWIENSNKASAIQPTFRPFNMAPIDDPAFAKADFSNGCAIMQDCGMGLTPLGYYPCAVAGGIDRILGAELGRSRLPADHDQMLDATKSLCQLCGRFQDGHFIPKPLRSPMTEVQMSPTWTELYSQWRLRRLSHADKDQQLEPVSAERSGKS